jgi:hypothetical protein
MALAVQPAGGVRFVAVDAERAHEALSAVAQRSGELPLILWRPSTGAWIDLDA